MTHGLPIMSSITARIVHTGHQLNFKVVVNGYSNIHLYVLKSQARDR